MPSEHTREGHLHTIFISRHAPWPPNGGVQLRNWQNLSCVARLGSVDLLVVHAEEGDRAPDLVAESLLLPPGPRLRGLERRAFWHRRAALPSSLRLVQDRGLRWLEERLKAHPGALVVLEEVFLGGYLETALGHGGRVVFDAHNVEADLRQKTGTGGTGFLGQLRAKALAKRMSELEGDLVRRSHHVWACSETDRRLFGELYGDTAPIAVVPNTVAFDAYADVRATRPKAQGNNIAMTGTFGYPPNVEAAHFLIEELLPRMARERPETELFLIGRDPQPFMLDAAKANERIHVTGPVPSVKPFLEQADVLVAPLFTGSGTRLKIVEAFTAGRPVVSTAKGAEGIEANDGEHVFLREDADGMAQAIFRLWDEPELRESMIDAALELARERYSWDTVEAAIRASLA